MSRFQAKLREEKMRDTTVARHLRHIRAALSWAVSMNMLPKVPYYVDLDSAEVADQLWANWGATASNAQAQGNTLGNTNTNGA